MLFEPSPVVTLSYSIERRAELLADAGYLMASGAVIGLINQSALNHVVGRRHDRRFGIWR